MNSWAEPQRADARATERDDTTVRRRGPAGGNAALPVVSCTRRRVRCRGRSPCVRRMCWCVTRSTCRSPCERYRSEALSEACGWRVPDPANGRTRSLRMAGCAGGRRPAPTGIMPARIRWHERFTYRVGVRPLPYRHHNPQAENIDRHHDAAAMNNFQSPAAMPFFHKSPHRARVEIFEVVSAEFTSPAVRPSDRSR